MKKYLPQEIEPKWLQKWDEEKLYRFNLVKGKDTFYTLVELPYPLAIFRLTSESWLWI
jgi:leucyl-tRNA synthetase